MTGMRAVGLKVLKNKLSEYVRLAERGETVLVTDRDRVVAEIVPPDRSRSALLADALLAEAMRQGLVTPPALPSTDVPPRKPVAPLRELAGEIEQDRADR
ncbi:MAG: type II toxin-antitoxin system Phd/YefM family antitoxin [Burkholderiales bacterium]|nr:type II toxin-antitoxin system Phd/YefM family antitoxin [Burkholderiales bacterium]